MQTCCWLSSVHWHVRKVFIENSILHVGYVCYMCDNLQPLLLLGIGIHWTWLDEDTPWGPWVKCKKYWFPINISHGLLLYLICRTHKSPLSRACRKQYREIQYIMNMLNYSFEIYLALFPTIILFALGILLYGILRFWHLDLITYSNFPACGFRCMVELFTIIVLAGQVNSTCKKQIEKLKKRQHEELLGNNNEFRKLNAWSNRVELSYPLLACRAGPFYNFENTILLCTISNLIHIMVNIWLLAVWSVFHRILSYISPHQSKTYKKAHRLAFCLCTLNPALLKIASN